MDDSSDSETNDSILDSKELLERFLLQSKDFIHVIPPSKFRKLIESVLVRGQRKELLPLQFVTDLYNVLNQQKELHLQQVRDDLDEFHLSEALAGTHEEYLDIEFEPLRTLVGQIINLNLSIESECDNLETQIDSELKEIESIVANLNAIEDNTVDLNTSVSELKEKLSTVEEKLLSTNDSAV